MNNTTIEERIYHFRTRNHWSQTELGEKIKEITGKPLGRDVISNYEKGRRKVPSELVPVLAKIFGISTDELFYKYEEVVAKSPTLQAIEASEKLAKKDVTEAYLKAMEALKQSQVEIQALRDQAETFKNEMNRYKKEAEEAQAVIDKVKKNLSL
ncbi:helix-turn-helix domain-containing protein [Fulvivirga marina]|uniref:helix-turn-helix domain-containing protein n=1 Tax=Fulvivirga marina TaxID=2494733 RepID=UPI00192DBEBF|nr:helix-turn-helix transcriptional regulator [Fulvivirga marina]